MMRKEQSLRQLYEDIWYCVAPVEVRYQFDSISGAKEAATQQQRQEQDLGRKGCFSG
jgi:hypothetical protein